MTIRPAAFVGAVLLSSTLNSIAVNSTPSTANASTELASSPQADLTSARLEIRMPSLLEDELEQFDADAPVPIVAVLRSSVEQIIQREGLTESGLRWMLARLRFMRSERLIFNEPMNSDVVRQLKSLTDEVEDAIKVGMFGDAPLSDYELRECCDVSNVDMHVGESLPYFRTPMPLQAETSIRANLRSRLDEMSKHSSFLWMNDPMVTPDDNRTIWKHFVRQVISQLVLMPAVRHVDRRIEEQFGDLLNRPPMHLPPGSSATQAPVAPFPPVSRERVESEFDFVRPSHERVYGLLLPLLPLLCAADAAREWQCHDLEYSVDLPDATLTATCSVAVSPEWLCFVFGYIGASNGRHYAERQLVKHCLMFDRRQRSLYEYDNSENSRRHLVQSDGQILESSIFFLPSYRQAEVFNALACLDELAGLWAHRGQKGNNVGKRESIAKHQGTLAVLLGREGIELQKARLDVNRIEVPVDAGHVCVMSQDANGSEPTKVALPSIHYPYSLSAQSGGPSQTRLGAAFDVFPAGVRLQCGKQPAGSAVEVRMASPKCMKVRLLARQTKVGSQKRDNNIEEAEELAVSRRLLRTNKDMLLANLLDSLLSEMRSENVLEPASDLRLITDVMSRNVAADYPTELKFYSREVQIGLQWMLGRRDKVLSLLAKQSKDLQSCSDRAYVDSYFRFYASRLAARYTPQTSRVKTPCYCCISMYDETDDAGSADSEYLGSGGLTSRTRAWVLPNRSAGGSQSNQESGDVCDVATELRKLVAHELKNLELAEYILQQFSLFWTRFPELALAPRGHTDIVLSRWREMCTRLERTPNSSYRATLIATEMWHMYHCLRYYKYPLDSDELILHKRQVSALEGHLNAARDSICTRAELPEAAREEVVSETRRCVERLKDYCSSPFYPFLCYPLDEASFNECLSDIAREFQEHLETFVALQEQRRHTEMLRIVEASERGFNNADFFQNRLRRWAGPQASAVVAHSMGSIVRHYGLITRDFDYDDPTVFPFQNVSGMSLSYRMQEGLSVVLCINWDVDNAR